jgi:hypothetical protein
VYFVSKKERSGADNNQAISYTRKTIQSLLKSSQHGNSIASKHKIPNVQLLGHRNGATGVDINNHYSSNLYIENHQVIRSQNLLHMKTVYPNQIPKWSLMQVMQPTKKMAPY